MLGADARDQRRHARQPLDAPMDVVCVQDDDTAHRQSFPFSAWLGPTTVWRMSIRLVSGPRPTWRWCQVARDLVRRVKVHVADESVLHHIQSRIQHDRAWLEHRASHQSRLPRADEEQIGLPRDRREIGRARVAERDRRALTQEEQRGGLPTDVAASHDHRIQPTNRQIRRAQQFERGVGGAGDEAGEAEHESPSVGRPQPVNVLLRRQRLRDDPLANVPGQRQQQRDAIHRRIAALAS